MSSRSTVLLTVMMVCALALAGCGVEISRNADGSLRAEAEISEQQLQSEISGALADPSLQRIEVDLGQGVVFVRGERSRPGGGVDWVTFALDLGAADGSMTARVSDLEVNGYDVGPSAVERWNRRIADNLTRAGRRTPNSQLQRVEVSPSGVTLIWRIETVRSRE